MTATMGRLFWIELRRSTALLTIPVLIGLAWLAWYLFQNDDQRVSYHWPDVSENIGVAAIFLGPAAGGLAAWAAGRDRRHGLGDLLRTTPRPAVSRELNLLSATTAWIVVAYAAAGIYFGVTTALKATWGGPVLAPILIGLLAITVQAVIGFAVGSFSTSLMQSRLIAALVPVVLFLAELLPILIQGGRQQVGPNMTADTYPYENLSAVSIIQSLGGSIFWSSPMDIAWAAVAWLGGFGGLALALILVRHRPRSGIAWGLVVTMVLTIGVGWSQLVPAPVTGADISSSHAIAYEPVCVQRSIPVCVHPANESFLDETADLIDSIVRPLAGIPGAPVRAEQPRPSRAADLSPWTTSTVPGTIPVEPVDTVTEARFVAQIAAIGAVRTSGVDPLALSPAQSAIAIWLLRQAGWEPAEEINSMMQFGGVSSMAEYDQTMADVLAAAARFAALTPEEQRAWLETNLVALRAGSLGLEALP